MSKLKEKDVEEIKRVIEEEFPNDPALQHVHIARKIIAKEAELEGLSFLEYIKSRGETELRMSDKRMEHYQGQRGVFL